jgi:hypothetical protein
MWHSLDENATLERAFGLHNSETTLFGAVSNQTAKSMNPRSGSVETSFTVT